MDGGVTFEAPDKVAPESATHCSGASAESLPLEARRTLAFEARLLNTFYLLGALLGPPPAPRP